MRNFAGRIGAVLFWLAIVNFAAFTIICFSIGGDALNGKVEDGHYYLWKINHRYTKYVETTPTLWRFNRVHALSMIATHCLGILVGGPLMAYSGRSEK